MEPVPSRSFRPEHRWVAAACDVAMAGLAPVRAKLLPQASGRVLELGAGTGLNFRFYAQGVEHLTACEPDPHMLRRARRKLSQLGSPATLDDASGEQLPYPDRSFDTVVATFVLCTIPEPGLALQEARRVLRPGGRLLFAEHVAHPSRAGRTVQDAVDRPWSWIAGGCHLNRDALMLIRAAGFEVLDQRSHGPQRWTLAPIVSGQARLGTQ